MANVVAVMASSHAFTFRDPAIWDGRRAVTRRMFAEKWGLPVPPEQPQVEAETLEGNRARFQRITDRLADLRRCLQELRPDTLVVLGDDQHELYKPDNVPQFAIYVGEGFETHSRDDDVRRRYRCNVPLANELAGRLVRDGFDLAVSERLPDGRLPCHAHEQILSHFDPEGRLSVVPLLINAFHAPAPSPRRCYELGQALARALATEPSAGRVVVFASGGLSHFPASFPWPQYRGDRTLGAISEGFDRWMVSAIGSGDGAALCGLDAEDLFENGADEVRQWIVALGVVGRRDPEWIVYEPFYRGVQGMGVALWRG